MKRLIYLDFAAATPIDDRVMLVMEPYFKTDFIILGQLPRSQTCGK